MFKLKLKSSDNSVNILLEPYRLVTHSVYVESGIHKYSFDVEIERRDGHAPPPTESRKSSQSEFRKFVTDISIMQNNVDFADVTLCCDGTEIHCHVAILAAHSTYFKAMFRQMSFIEGRTKRMEIKNMSLTTLKAMKKFIYSTKFDHEATNISALFSAACLYGIPDLQSKCATIMMRSVTVDNAAEFYFEGILIESDGLKRASMDFIAKNFATVKKTKGWRKRQMCFGRDPGLCHHQQDRQNNTNRPQAKIPLLGSGCDCW